MSKRVDDLSEDPFDPDNLPEQQTIIDDMRDVAMDKAKTAAGDYMRDAPKRMGRRMFWSFIVNLGFAGEFQKERILNRLERGEKVGWHEIIFGRKFSIFGLVRTIIFLIILAAIAYYLWSQGFIQQIMEQQALIESLQQTPVP